MEESNGDSNHSFPNGIEKPLALTPEFANGASVESNKGKPTAKKNRRS